MPDAVFAVADAAVVAVVPDDEAAAVAAAHSGLPACPQLFHSTRRKICEWIPHET